MLNHIIRFSIRNKLIIGLLTLGLISWGVYSFTKLPIDAVPDITNNQVLVITVSPSLAAPEVERLITFPIEQATIIPMFIGQGNKCQNVCSRCDQKFLLMPEILPLDL